MQMSLRRLAYHILVVQKDRAQKGVRIHTCVKLSTAVIY